MNTIDDLLQQYHQELIRIAEKLGLDSDDFNIEEILQAIDELLIEKQSQD